MRVDRDGRALQQVTVWLPVEVVKVIRTERFNLSAFVRQNLELLYCGEPVAEIVERRLTLIEAARESLARQREVDAEREADMERARAAVRRMRADRDAARNRQDGIADALLQIVGDGPVERYRRLLPENDAHGDRADDWDGLVRRVCRLCGAEVDSAEVVVALRALLAAGAGSSRGQKGVRGG